MWLYNLAGVSGREATSISKREDGKGPEGAFPDQPVPQVHVLQTGGICLVVCQWMISTHAAYLGIWQGGALGRRDAQSKPWWHQTPLFLPSLPSGSISLHPNTEKLRCFLTLVTRVLKETKRSVAVHGADREVYRVSGIQKARRAQEMFAPVISCWQLWGVHREGS